MSTRNGNRAGAGKKDKRRRVRRAQLAMRKATESGKSIFPVHVGE